MGPRLDALIALFLGQLDGAIPARAADAGPAYAAQAAADAAQAAADAAQAAVDAARAAPDAAQAAAQAADAAVGTAKAAGNAADSGLVDAAIKAFDAARPIVDDPPAAPWVEYVVYGVIAALILYFVVRGLRADPAEAANHRTNVARPELPTSDKSEDEIEREARHAFGRAEAVVPASGSGRIRIVQKAGAPAPGAIGPKTPSAAAEPSKGAQKAPQTAPATAETPDEVSSKGKPAAEAKTPSKPSAEAAGKTLREGLTRTRDGFVGKLAGLFGKAKTIDDDLLGDLEEALFTADIGVRTSQKLVDLVHESLGKKDFDRPDKVWAALKQQIRDLLDVGAPPLDIDRAKPLVIMVVGVNGAGKTTSIGKLARRYTDAGKKVLLAAGDTFRAAAVEQLEVWADRAGVPVVKGESGQDPSSVIFEAIERAEREGYDVCICDTAGRLQAKKELMDELAKVHRVSGKAFDGAPHEVWLVLDSTNGQNAISQAKVFTEAVAVTGLVLTKLDGTAKGGVIIGISDEMRLPVRYIGIGEKVEDLRAFDADAFAEALLADD